MSINEPEYELSTWTIHILLTLSLPGQVVGCVQASLRRCKGKL